MSKEIFDVKSFSKTKKKVKCENCGQYVDKTYQMNACKECLCKVFSKLRPVLNSGRAA
jgi:DNA-directed RNA polymerase subunit RPC12/RpoP